MRLTILGSGDAFGSGGRLQTSFHLARAGGDVLIDCGATALIGMARAGLDPNRVSTIIISHLHGDHFAGLVWWALHARYVARRSAPLTVLGPPGIEARFATTSEALFAGSTTKPRGFDLEFLEHPIGGLQAVDGLVCSAVEVVHPSGAPSCGVRVETEGRIVSYTGDTEWTEALPPLARGADLFIAECYSYKSKVPSHTSWAEIEANLARLEARRILLTHMGAGMLAKSADIRATKVMIAQDGMTIDL